MAAQYGSGLVCGQRVGERVDPIGHASGNQRLIRIAFQEGHDHFHPDAWNGHRAKSLTGPTGRYPQPATAELTVRLGAIPVELYFDTAIFIAVDLFIGRARHTGSLAYQLFAWTQRRAVDDVCLNGAEFVAIALAEAIGGLCVVADSLLKDLWLFASVFDADQQPLVVAGFARMFGQVKQVSAA